MSLGNPYEGVWGLPHREQLKKELIEMLLKKQAAKIKEIKPEKDLDDQEWVWDEPHEGVLPKGCGVPPLWDSPPQPKLWYLIAVLKKPGISLEQVGDQMGLSFLGNIICQFKLLNPGSCDHVCFLYNYFQKVSPIDWPAKKAILKKLTKSLPKMEQTRNKAEKKFQQMVVGCKQWGETPPKQQLSLMFFYHCGVPPLHHQCGLKNAVLSFEK